MAVCRSPRSAAAPVRRPGPAKQRRTYRRGPGRCCAPTQQLRWACLFPPDCRPHPEARLLLIDTQIRETARLLPTAEEEARQLVRIGLEVELLRESVGHRVSEHRQPI